MRFHNSILVCFIFLLQLFAEVNSQELSKEYTDLITKGRQYYFAKDYKNAAATFSQAYKLAGDITPVIDRHRAAFSFALAGNADSAFFYLENITRMPVLTFDDFTRIVPDEDYISIHQDPRWDPTVNLIFNKAHNEFHQSLLKSTPSRINAKRINAAAAWAFKKNTDSVFHQLNKIAGSPDITFDDVYLVQDNFYLKEYNATIQWHEFIDRAFTSLSKKYIPSSAFSKPLIRKNILIDNGHHNLHNITNTYNPLAGTLNKAGFNVEGHNEKFGKGSLDGWSVLIISNPHSEHQDSLNAKARREKIPIRWSTAASQPAYTPDEIEYIREWVSKGGSLLLIMDHAPSGASTGQLAAAFNVESRNVGTYDLYHRDPTNRDTTLGRSIIFTKSKGLLGNHPILNGVDSITTYTGQSILGPKDAHPLLILPATAIDQDWLKETKEMRTRSAAGRLQAVAFDYGKGRVVVYGEAAQTRTANISKNDRGNWKFLLNTIRWLMHEKM